MLVGMTRPLLVPAARFDLAAFGELVADPSRAAMLLSLMDGCARPASELAAIAGVTPATASSHLGRLLAGGFVTVEPIGRHRYFRLANVQVAEALEAIAMLRPGLRAPAVPMDAHKRALVHARTCYRHLAGRLGVALLGALERRGFLALRDGALALGAAGLAWCEGVGIEVAARDEGKTCLDWTERRYHLGGALGGQLTDELFRVGWIARGTSGASERAVRVTSRGRRAFRDELGLPAELLTP